MDEDATGHGWPAVVADAANPSDNPIGAAAREVLENLPPHLRAPLLRRQHASQYLKLRHGIDCAPATLAKLASVGGGPGFFRAGRVPLYPRAELDAWAAARLGRLLRSTSDAPRR